MAAWPFLFIPEVYLEVHLGRCIIHMRTYLLWACLGHFSLLDDWGITTYSLHTVTHRWVTFLKCGALMLPVIRPYCVHKRISCKTFSGLSVRVIISVEQ